MDKRKLENKAAKAPKKRDTKKKIENKDIIYVCAASFPGLPEGHEMKINSTVEAQRLIDKGYVKIKD